MPYENVDASISAADLQAVKDAFATIIEKLPNGFRVFRAVNPISK